MLYLEIVAPRWIDVMPVCRRKPYVLRAAATPIIMIMISNDNDWTWWCRSSVSLMAGMACVCARVSMCVLCTCGMGNNYNQFWLHGICNKSCSTFWVKFLWSIWACMGNVMEAKRKNGCGGGETNSRYNEEANYGGWHRRRVERMQLRACYEIAEERGRARIFKWTLTVKLGFNQGNFATGS